MENTSGTHARSPTRKEYCLTIDDHIIDPDRILIWIFRSGGIKYLLRIENDDIREISDLESPSILDMEYLCRLARHLMYRFLPRKELLDSHVPTKHTWERTEISRMHLLTGFFVIDRISRSIG